MKIRCVTLGADIQRMKPEMKTLREDLTNLTSLRQQLDTANMEVESIRVATTPFTQKTKTSTFIQNIETPVYI